MTERKEIFVVVGKSWFYHEETSRVVAGYETFEHAKSAINEREIRTGEQKALLEAYDIKYAELISSFPLVYDTAWAGEKHRLDAEIKRKESIENIIGKRPERAPEEYYTVVKIILGEWDNTKFPAEEER